MDITSADIQVYIDNNIPEYFTFLNEMFYQFLNTMFFTDPVITADIVEVDDFFNPFSPNASITFPFYDTRFKLIDQAALLPQLAFSINDVSYKFIYAYLASLFSSIEMFYYDTASKLLVPIASNGTPPNNITEISFLSGHYSSASLLTGAVSSLYALYAKIYFDVFSFVGTVNVANSALQILEIIKPARLHIFFQPIFQIILNNVIQGDQFYNANIFTYLALNALNLPSGSSLIYTDSGAYTDASPLLHTDENGTPITITSKQYIQVQYFSNPGVWVLISGVTTNYDSYTDSNNVTHTLFRWVFYVTEDVQRIYLGDPEQAMFDLTLYNKNYVTSLSPYSLPGNMRMELIYET